MDTKEDKGNFVDFIADTLENKDLFSEYAKITDVADLKAFFIHHNYLGIKEEELPKLIMVNEKLADGMPVVEYY